MSHVPAHAYDALQIGRRARLAQAAEDKAARLEDLTWMAATGEGLHNAAHRLNISTSALEKWLYRHAPALLHRLQEQDYRDHNAATYRDGLGLHAGKHRRRAPRQEPAA